MGVRYLKKRCPKCGGNLFCDGDHHGWYEQCLQCGYMCDLQEIQKAMTKERLGGVESTHQTGESARV